MSKSSEKTDIEIHVDEFLEQAKKYIGINFKALIFENIIENFKDGGKKYELLFLRFSNLGDEELDPRKNKEVIKDLLLSFSVTNPPHKNKWLIANIHEEEGEALAISFYEEYDEVPEKTDLKIHVDEFLDQASQYVGMDFKKLIFENFKKNDEECEVLYFRFSNEGDEHLDLEKNKKVIKDLLLAFSLTKPIHKDKWLVADIHDKEGEELSISFYEQYSEK